MGILSKDPATFSGPRVSWNRAAGILKALAHPARLRIVHGLARREECHVNRIAHTLGLPQSTVSQHLAVLKSHGLLQTRRLGLRVCYRVNRVVLAQLLGWLDTLQSAGRAPCPAAPPPTRKRSSRREKT